MEARAAPDRVEQVGSKAIYRYRLKAGKTPPVKWRTLLNKHIPNLRKYRFAITTVTGETYSSMDGEPTDEEIVYDLFVTIWDLGNSSGVPHGGLMCWPPYLTGWRCGARPRRWWSSTCSGRPPSASWAAAADGRVAAFAMCVGARDGTGPAGTDGGA